MSRLAILIDGGYLATLCERHFKLRIDFSKLPAALCVPVVSQCSPSMDFLRTYFYDCLPVQRDSSAEEIDRLEAKRRFFTMLRALPSFAVREGRLKFRGVDRHGVPIFEQKGVDLMLGVDLVALALKRQVTHVVLVSGDGDLLSAVELAQSEGVVVWLAHGPSNTCSSELWSAVDNRIALDAPFLQRIARDW